MAPNLFENAQTEQQVDDKLKLLQEKGYDITPDLTGQATTRKLQIRAKDVLTRKRAGESLEDDREWVATMYEVKRVNTVKLEKFETTGTDYKLIIRDELFHEDMSLEESLHILYFVLEGILNDLLGHLPDETYARVVILSPDFDIGETDCPISTSMQKKEYITPELLLARIENVVQSKKRFLLENDMTIHVIHTKVPAGMGRKKNSLHLRDKRSVTSICQENDSLCLARSIIIGQTSIESGNASIHSLIKSPRRLQEKVEQLHRDCRIQIKYRPYTLADAAKFQHHLQGRYQLIIISSSTMNKPVYTGIEHRKKIFIYHHENHYDFINNIDGFYGKDLSLCTVCWALHARKYPHLSCFNLCKLCMHTDCCNSDEISTNKWTLCTQCSRYFPNQVCFQNHKKVPLDLHQCKSSCDSFKKCTHCHKTLASCKLPQEKHNCGKIYCNVCKMFREESNHLCYVQKIKKLTIEEEIKKGPKGSVYYFDFETDSSTGQHVPIMLAFSDETGSFTQHFWGKDCCKKFCEIIFTKQYKNSVFLSHNGSRFDNYFILDHIFQEGWTPEVIYNGGSIMYIKVPKYNITFKDTYLYIARPLAAIPKMFGIKDSAKTFFPHLLPFDEYENYVGEYVDTSFYGVDQMKKEKRDECIEWVNAQRSLHENTPFNYKERMIEYCKNDVEVLRACGQQFRSLFISKGEIDPFLDAMTLSQAASYVYKKLHMPEESIAIIPPWGYKNAKSFSQKSIVWLEYLSKKYGTVIKHARNGGEHKIPEGFYVDGFIPPSLAHLKGQVLEFAGCWVHGCPNCFNKSTVNPQSDCTMQELYEKYENRKALIIDAGYTYEEIWEHTFDSNMKTDPELHKFSQNLNLQAPLRPKDCLYGGRTEPFCLYKQPDESKGETIRYLDINSLYPYSQRANVFPKGHPNVLISPDKNDFSKWFGLIKARVTPPQKLWLPVLPLKCNGKLLFSLCYTCSKESSQSECTHKYEERGWVGNFTTIELAAALKRGYILDQVYEVWDWPPEKRTSSLFTEYVNSFLKIKLISSGFPQKNMTEEAKAEYARELTEREGIPISPDEIEDNPGLRALAKQILNGLWGKFCQSLSKEQTLYITEPAEYFKLLIDDTCDLNSVRRVNDEIIEVSYKKPEEMCRPHSFVNHAIASFVTSYARLTLYSYIEPLGKNLLYCDTDSCVYITAPGLPDITPGPCLGDMSCEIYSSHKVNDTIQTWVSVGPKSYGYQLKDNPHIQNVKCKGITLNYSTSKDINLKYMLELVCQEECRDDRRYVTYPDQMKRDKKRLRIEKMCLKKSFRFTFNKRVMNSYNYETLPIGYVQ